MADETVLPVSIEANDNASKDFEHVADTVSALSEALATLTTTIKPLATQLNKAEKGIAAMAKANTVAADGASEVAQAVTSTGSAAQRASEFAREHAKTLEMTDAAYSRIVSESNRAQAAFIGETQKIEKLNTALKEGSAYALKMQTQLAKTGAKSGGGGDAGYSNIRVSMDTLRADLTKESSKINKEIAESMARNLGSSLSKAGAGAKDLHQSLFVTRFALNDIAATAGIAGTALLAMNGAVVNAAATYESAMAAISRTSGATGSELEGIRSQFVDLAQSIPAGFDNLAQIGELAGQLNIPSQNIGKFTETVAQFVSSTDVATQSAAEAFGRLDTLLPDVQGNYNALGSSILNVGVNSVATESAIISTTTQIAAAGAQAGFTASEVIGLAASFASLGVAPEAARGTTIRVLSEIRQAVQEGGASLEEFARISGTSAQGFATSWNANTADTFIQFLQGLQKEGADAETSLRGLGINAVRDLNALLRMSQNVEVVADNFSYAADGFSDATQLAEAFGITSETLNSRLAVLGQSFQALLATLGDSGTGPIKELVNGLIDLIKVATDLSSSPIVQWAAIFVGITTAMGGLALLLVSLTAKAGATAIAMRTTNIELKTMRMEAAAAGVPLQGMTKHMTNAGIAATTMGGAMKAALIGTGIGLGDRKSVV